MGRGTVKLVLDTCVLSNRSFTEWLSYYNGDVCISSITYMERRRQLINHRKDPKKLDDLLKESHIQILPFGKTEATVSSDLMSSRPEVCPVCNKLDWNDAMIYSSIGNRPTLLVTENVSDFPFEKDGDRVKTTAQIREIYGD